MPEIIEISTDNLIDNPGNFFRNLSEEEIKELTESIKLHGIMHPLVVRPLADGKFQIISGHQRRKAAERAGLKTVPCIVTEMDDTEAELALIEANLETRQLSTMEMARAIRKKKELLGIRNGVHGKITSAQCAEVLGISERQFHKLDKLNDLIPELQDMVDSGKLGIAAGEKLAGLPQEMQKTIYDTLGGDISALTNEDIKRIKEENDRGYLVLNVLQEKLKDTEEKLKAFQDVYDSKENIEKEIKVLRQKKKELEYDLMDRENALTAIQKRAVQKGTAILELLNQACRPIQAIRPELEVIFSESNIIDEGTSVYILRWAEVLRNTAAFLEENIKVNYPLLK
jgi:ParB family chromosome partitioning protein